MLITDNWKSRERETEIGTGMGMETRKGICTKSCTCRDDFGFMGIFTNRIRD